MTAIRTDLIDHCQPIGPTKEMPLGKITIEHMRYRHLEREPLPCPLNRGYYLEIVYKLTRYQTAINHPLYEVMKKLERLQTTRKAWEWE